MLVSFKWLTQSSAAMYVQEIIIDGVKESYPL